MRWREGLKRENKTPFSTLSWLSTWYSVVVPWPFSGKTKLLRHKRSVGNGEQVMPYALSVLHKKIRGFLRFWLISCFVPLSFVTNENLYTFLCVNRHA